MIPAHLEIQIFVDEKQVIELAWSWDSLKKPPAHYYNFLLSYCMRVFQFGVLFAHSLQLRR